MPIARALLGIFFFCAVAWLLSSNRRNVNVRAVVWGIVLQVLLALLILKTDAGRIALNELAEVVTRFLKFGEEGARLVFGKLVGFVYDKPVTEGVPPQPLQWFGDFPFQIPAEDQKYVSIIFAFKALPTIIYFSAVMAILYYLGIMQVIIWVLAKVMSFLMRLSGAESLAMAANIFVGQTEAPLVVRPYVPGMTRSELMALMTGGFATIAGSVLAVYIGVLGPEYAGHLLAASFMSAPAAFVVAKIMVPETERSVTAGKVELRIERESANLLDATAQGTSIGLQLYLNVLAMLIAFVAIIAVINWILGAIPVGGEGLTIQRLLGWLFSPVAWVMGVNWSDCQNFGSLLGIKIAVNEFVGYTTMAGMEDGAMSARSLKMAAYALCGFANFGSIGIQIGGISPLAPARRTEICQLALRAMIGGAMASWMTATIAGAFVDE
ncbi:MAG: nucleoside transporter C-terminal domain-containing protein [Planctomycetota bacterium]